MANTLQNLFPQTPNRAEDFTVYPCCVEFSAPVVGGYYVFDEEHTPAKFFGKLGQPQKGVIAGLMISANCKEEDFTTALEEPLTLQILRGGNNTPVNMAAFPIANFSHGEIFQEQWRTSGQSMLQEEEFKLAIKGRVYQLSSMTQNELKIRVIFNYIRAAADKLR